MGPRPTICAGTLFAGSVSAPTGITIATSAWTSVAAFCPVIRSTSVSAMIWSRVRSSPVFFRLSVCARSAARHATPCSTGRNPESTAIVSGAGRSPTRRSVRAVRPRNTKPCGSTA